MPSQGAAEARALDQASHDLLAMPSILLMENAARAVAELALAKLALAPQAPAGILVLAGPGNNGGDGLAIARLLSPRARVALSARPDATRAPDAALQLRVLESAGISLHEAAEDLDELARGVGLIIDAMLGTGLRADPRGRIAAWIRWVNQQDIDVLSVDLPSGLCADTGCAFTPCVRARWTLSLARPKRGLLLADGPDHAGEVQVAGIGLPEDWVRRWEQRKTKP